MRERSFGSEAWKANRRLQRRNRGNVRVSPTRGVTLIDGGRMPRIAQGETGRNAGTDRSLVVDRLVRGAVDVDRAPSAPGSRYRSNDVRKFSDLSRSIFRVFGSR